MVVALLLGMSVQLPQAALPAFRWTWYLVMPESLGSVQESATCLSPAVAVSPVGFAGFVAAGAVSCSETVSPLLQTQALADGPGETRLPRV